MITNIKVKCCPFCGTRATIRGAGWEPACRIQYVSLGCHNRRNCIIHPAIKFGYCPDDLQIDERYAELLRFWNSSSAKEDVLEVADALPADENLAPTLIKIVEQMNALINKEVK